MGEGVGVFVVFGCLEDCPDVVSAVGGFIFVGFVDDYAGFSVGFEVCQVGGGELSVGAGEVDVCGCVEACVA